MEPISVNLFVDIVDYPCYAAAVQIENAADEDWDLLCTFFPDGWRRLARTTGALKGLRQDKDEEDYLRVLMMHFGCGLSLVETVTRAKQAEVGQLVVGGVVQAAPQKHGVALSTVPGLV